MEQSSEPSPAPSPTVVFGVLGGVASGKSTAARALAGAGGRVISADALAHEALESPGIRQRLVEAFGPGALTAEGSVDRAFLARRVFRDPASRKRLEGWIHPYVRERIRASLVEARAERIPRVVLDVPLLLENDADHGLVGLCDRLVFVEVSEAERDRRARADRGWQAGEVARREAAQLPLDVKRQRADHVIPGEGTEAELVAAIARLIDELGLA